MDDHLLDLIDGKRDHLCELLVAGGLDPLTRSMIEAGIEAIDLAVTEIIRLRAELDLAGPLALKYDGK